MSRKKPVDCGGLGIRSVDAINKALLGKWLWRLGDNSQGLWRQIIVDKYRVGSNGWLVPLLRYRVSSIWKSVSSVLPEFDKCIRYQVNNGQKICFWNDIRCGDISLSNQFLWWIRIRKRLFQTIISCWVVVLFGSLISEDIFWI